MSIKYIFVFGFLFVSAFAEEQIVEPEKSSQPEKVSESEKEALAEAKAEVNFGDLKKDDESVNIEAVENIENTDNGVKASASASTSFNFDEFLAKWLQDCKQNKENNNEGESNKNETNEEKENKKQEKSKVAENNQEAENNAQKKENTAEEDEKSPFVYTYKVHARASASASASSSSSLYYKLDEPKKEENNEKTQGNVEDSVEQTTDEENPVSEELKQPKELVSPFPYNVHARSSASASASSSFYYNFHDPKEEKYDDESAEKPQETDDVAEDTQENFKENEQPIDVENVEVLEHCNQQNSEDKEPLNEEPLDDEPLKTEDETQVEEVEQ